MGKAEAKHTPATNSSAADASVSLEDLAREQGVKAVSNLDELGAFLPAEDDPDAFLAFVRSQRAERRAAAGAKQRGAT